MNQLKPLKSYISILLSDLLDSSFLEISFKFWTELEELSHKEKLTSTKEQYHKFYLEILWRGFMGFGVFTMIALISALLIFKSDGKFAAIFP